MTLDLFESDVSTYTFIATNTIILEKARMLITKYGIKGLRTLDSIQLSTCVTLSEKVNAFLTDDKLLKSFFERRKPSYNSGLLNNHPEIKRRCFSNQYY